MLGVSIASTCDFGYNMDFESLAIGPKIKSSVTIFNMNFFLWEILPNILVSEGVFPQSDHSLR